jgi:hypothetical protein
MSETESLSPAESAYMKSGGTDTAGLEQEYSAGETSQPAPEGQAPAGTAAAPDTTPADGAGDDIDLETDTLITVGPDGKPRGKNGQFVPHQAFHAVREKYKATRSELQNYQEKFARADERLALLNGVLAGNQPAAAAAADDNTPPDPEKDIFGYVKWQAKQIERLSNELKTGSERQQSSEQERAFKSTYVADAMAFHKSTPEFKDAYAHLINGRDKELALMGMADQKQRAAFIAKEEKAIVEQALQRGVSPSQMLFQLAQSRGFTPKPAAAPQSDIAAKIENVKRSQAASASLTGTGGSAGEGLTAAALADMSEAEFESVMSKLSKSERARLLGG